VGGDLFKAVFIARQQHGHRTEAVASVIADRLVGLYCLLLVAAVGVSTTSLPAQTKPIVDGVLLTALVGAAAIGVWLAPITRRVLPPSRFAGLPLVGPLAVRALGAVEMYRSRYMVLAGAAALSVLAHCTTTLSFYAIALSLPGSPPSLAQHFAIVPLANVTGVLPLPLGALGALEGVMDFLYREMAGSHEGVLVTFGYRILTILLALVGAIYYFGSRRDVEAAIHEAEAEELTSPGDEAPGPAPAAAE
jgi:uncharacterized membrane protein YbhN (UPF0104 family)